MRIFALALTIMVAASPLSARTFRGCGMTYGTCASVSIAAERQADGSWAFTVTLTNTSGRQSGVAGGVYLEWNTNSIAGEGLRDVRIRDGEGVDRTRDYAQMDGGGVGFDGFREIRAPDETFWMKYSGVESADCAAHPQCAAQRLPIHISEKGDTTEYGYHTGPLTIRFRVDTFDPSTLSVSVMNYGSDGEWLAHEYYDLRTGPVTVTPEPVTLALFGSGLAAVGLARRRRR